MMAKQRMARLGLLYGIGLLSYGFLAGPRLLWQQPNEFVALAEAFLQGRLDLDPALAPYLDLATYQGRLYLPYPPAAALLYLPVVALLGRSAFPALLHLFLAAAVWPLFYLVLERYTGEADITHGERLWLVVLLAIGSPLAALAVRSNVYFSGQVTAVLFACLYLLAAWRGRHPGWAGLALGMAFLARGALVLGFPLALVELWRRPGGSRAQGLLRFGLGLGAVLLVALAYNGLRFHSPWEFGYHYLAWRDDPEIVRWGLFHPVYLERNLHAALLALPVLLPQFPYLAYHPQGMSLLLTTPALLLLPLQRHWSLTARALVLSAGLIALPALFYANTGFVQYGYRYALDFLPFLVLAMPLAGWRIATWRARVLILAGVVICLWGALLAARYPFTPELDQLIGSWTLMRYR